MVEVTGTEEGNIEWGNLGMGQERHRDPEVNQFVDLTHGAVANNLGWPTPPQWDRT